MTAGDYFAGSTVGLIGLALLGVMLLAVRGGDQTPRQRKRRARIGPKAVWREMLRGKMFTAAFLCLFAAPAWWFYKPGEIGSRVGAVLFFGWGVWIAVQCARQAWWGWDRAKLTPFGRIAHARAHEYEIEPGQH